jgi:hypothetical protein
MVKPRAQQPCPTSPSATKKRASDPAAADLGQQIGEKLRTMFDDVLTEPVPEKFRTLLEELERKSHEEPR